MCEPTNFLASRRNTFRIDHYLGKGNGSEPAGLWFFANPIFEDLWNRDRMENVQSAAEQLGIEKRAAYYDQIGALREIWCRTI